MRRHLVLTALAATLLMAGASAPASAGEYPVYACEPAAGDVNHSWFPESNSQHMAAYVNCPVPWSETRDWNRGLVTLHLASGATGNDPVGGFELADLRLRAPAGAALSRMTYSHTFCGAGSFEAGLMDDAGRWLHASAPGSCGTLVPSPWTIPLGGTPSIRLITVCARTRCNIGGGERAWASMRSATVWIADGTAPSVSITGGSLVDGGWHRGTQSLVVGGWDNVGIRHFDVYLDGKQTTGRDGACDWTYVVPCSISLAGVGVETPVVADGAHSVTLNALDSAGNWGSTSSRVLIDNTAPASPGDPQLAGGEQWRATNDFAVSWTNPPQSGTAPISGIDWTICPAANASTDAHGCSSGMRNGADVGSLSGLHVPGPGDWVARLWLRDAAGNADPRSSRTIALRYDPAAPDVQILGGDPADPQRVNVTASDALSGLASVEVEVRRDGDSAWVSLPVKPAGAQFTAVVDDAKLPRGHYVLRARARDAAGNERSSDVRGGGPAVLDLPLRLTTALRLGGIRTVRGRHGRRRTVLRRAATAAYGAPVHVRGKLTLPGGNPLAGAELQVFEQMALPGERWRRIGLLRTDRHGDFGYKALPGPSRTLLFSYGGTPLVRPRSGRVRLRVRARTSFEVNHAHVVNGDEVLFHGRVRGRLPASGKLLQLQAYSRGTWRTFATPRAARRSHRWRYRYRFSATRGLVRYRFRALVPPEAGFPYVRGASRRLSVTVRGL